MRLLLYLALTCLPTFASVTTAQTAPAKPNCDDDLIRRPMAMLEDPIAIREMRDAREAARHVTPHLSRWSVGVTNLDPALVESTFAELRAAKVDVDSDGVRSLFLVVQRYLVATSVFDRRLVALADILHVDVATVGRLANLFLQLDALAHRRELPKSAPQFLRDALDIKTFVHAELGDHLSAAARSFLFWKLNEVTRQRLRYARLAMNRERTQIILRSPIGVYRINLTDRVFERAAIAEPYVSATDAWDRFDDRVIHAQIEISTADGEAALYLRTALRADAFLHPHAGLPALRAFPQPTVPSDWQETEVITPMLKLDEHLVRAHGGKGPILIGLQMPVGTGKMPVGTSYLNRVPMVGKAPGVRPKHVVIVENTHLLTQAMANYQRDTQARPEKMAMIYGDEGFETLQIGTSEYKIGRGAKISPPHDWDVIFVSRSTFKSRHSTFTTLIGLENAKPSARRRPFRVTIDEGQHTGTEDGQFEFIFDLLENNLTKEDRVLVVSATLDHPHLNIIRDRLAGAVVAPLLLPDELASLRRGEQVMVHARVQFIRAMIAGLINPIDPRSVAGKSIEREGGYTEELKRSRAADFKMYRFVAEIIRKTRSPGAGYDRGLVFEPVIERADAGAAFLQELFDTEEGQRVAWSAHSDLSSEEGARRVRWLRGIKEYADTGLGHKFLTSVSQFLEGIDVPEINLLVVMRNFQSLIAMMQLLGRGARIDAFKTASRLIDMPGRVMQWLEEADILWLRVSTARPNMIASWDRPLLDAVALFEKPGQDLVTSSNFDVRAIKLEDVYSEERKRLAAWQEIRENDLIAATDARDGVLLALRRDPDDRRDEERINPTAWFGHFYAKFPGEVRTEWLPQWQQLKLEDRSVDPRKLTADQRKAAIRGFRLLARMFNGLSGHRDRLGLADIDTDEELTASGFQRIRLGLERRPDTIPYDAILKDLSPLSFAAADYAQAEDLREGLAEGLLFANSSPNLHREISKHANVPSAWDALNLVRRIFKERPALARAAGEYLDALYARVSAVQKTFDRELAATYALGFLVNVLVREHHLDSIKPWDLHALVGRLNGENVLVEDVNDRPSFHDLMMTLDLADSRLGGATTAEVAVVESPSAPPAREGIDASQFAKPVIEDLETGSFSRAAIERLTGPKGTFTYLQQARGRGKLRAPERMIAKLVRDALTHQTAFTSDLEIAEMPDLPLHLRVAHALVTAENHYRMASPMQRMGLPIPLPLEIFEADAFQRMTVPGENFKFKLPVAFDAVSVNENLPFYGLSGLEADVLLGRIERAEILVDATSKEFVVARINELRGVNDPVAALSVVIEILGRSRWMHQSKFELQALVQSQSHLRTFEPDSRNARAFAIAQLAWAMNLMSASSNAMIYAWSLAAFSPHRERPAEKHLRTTMRMSDIVTGLLFMTLRKLPSEDIEASPRVQWDVWSAVEPGDLDQVKSLLDDLRANGVTEFDFPQFFRSRRSFSPALEAKWKIAAKAPLLPRRAIKTDVGKLGLEELWMMLRAVRFLGAFYNELPAVDRLGWPQFSRNAVLSILPFAHILKTFDRQPNAPARLAAFDGPVPRSVSPMSPARLHLWQDRVGREVGHGGALSSRLSAWIISGLTGEPAEILDVIVDHLRATPRLRELIDSKKLDSLAGHTLELRGQPELKAQSMLYVAIADLVNFVIREVARDEKPWAASIGPKYTQKTDESLERPSWDDFLRVIYRGGLPTLDDKLEAFGVTPEELDQFMDPSPDSAGTLGPFNQALKDRANGKSLFWRGFFEDLRGRLPPRALARFKEDLARISLPKASTKIDQMDHNHARAIAHALLVYEKIFNGMSATERLGYEKLKSKKILEFSGFTHFLNAIDGNQRTAELKPVRWPRLTAGLRAGPDTRAPFGEARGAVDILRSLETVLTETRGFRGRVAPETTQFVIDLNKHISRSAVPSAWEGLAGDTVARVVNELIRAGDLRDLKPWRSGEYAEGSPETFEPIEPDQHNMDPTLADLIEVLDRSTLPD